MFFRKREINKLTFPPEDNSGQVETCGGKIKYADANYNHFTREVEIARINRIYAMKDRYYGAILCLCTEQGNNRIPVRYKGFRIVFEILSELLGLDEPLFLKTIHGKNEARQLLWKNSFIQTYSIVADAPADYGKGFEIQSPQKQFFSWDTPFTVLRDNEYTEYLYNENNLALKFRYPVRIGRLIFDRFSVHNYYRDDISLRFCMARCYDAEGSDKSYNDILGRLNSDFDIIEECDGTSRNFQVTVEEMYFNGRYQYDDEYNTEEGYTTLNICNQREYPELLANEEYEKRMQVTDHLTLKRNLKLNADYKLYSYPKRRPTMLNEQVGNMNIIWRDDANGKIGFADAKLSIIVDQEDIIRLTIDNLIPAKGSGGSTLMVELRESSPIGLKSLQTFKGKYRTINEYADKIQSVIGKKVILSKEFSDC